jgi:hypothetical protein
MRGPHRVQAADGAQAELGMGIRDWEWWYLALVWLVALGLSAVVGPRLVRSLRAPTAGRGAGRAAGRATQAPAAPLPLWQALIWLLVVIAALVITVLRLTGRGAAT